MDTTAKLSLTQLEEQMLDPETAAPRCGGERMNYAIGVQVLMEQAAKGSDVPAETLRD
jgi:hypothetical protein